MAVDFDKFAKWALDRFGEENVLVNKGKGEVRINSIFEPDDDDHHLWCSPGGGKKKRKLGTYHCFKTDKKGSLVKLVQLVDSCERDDALAVLQGIASVRDLERKLEEFFAAQEEVVIEPPKPDFTLPVGCYLISELGNNNWWGNRAREYLAGRKLPEDGLYICTEDRYKGRIIIPYYDRNGKLIYFNGRHLGQSKCKYLGPPKEIGVGKEDVVYMAGPWPEAGAMVHLCEGEFNAKSLKVCELNGAACGGKNMSEKQALMLADYRIVLCLDRDKAGKAGTAKMSSVVSMIETCKGVGGEKLMYVIPPKGFNDWNEMLVKTSPEVVYYYIANNQKPLDYSGPMGTIGTYFGLSDIWR